MITATANVGSGLQFDQRWDGCYLRIGRLFEIDYDSVSVSRGRRKFDWLRTVPGSIELWAGRRRLCITLPFLSQGRWTRADEEPRASLSTAEVGTAELPGAA